MKKYLISMFAALSAALLISGVLIPGASAAPGAGVPEELFLQEGVGAVPRTYVDKGRESLSAFDFMTPAQIAAVKSYALAVDVTLPVQKAMDAAWTRKADLFVPAGGYLVTGLTLPGTYPTLDQRSYAFRMYGQGYGTPFSLFNNAGTVFKSITDAPVLADRAMPGSNAQGTYEIDHLRFDGTSATPVVLIHGLYGTSSVHHNVIYQRGAGDGFKLLFAATAHIHENYVINKDYVTPVLGAARTGVGINFQSPRDAGLVTFRKNTSRGFLTGYRIGGTATAYSAKITECEASTVHNAIVLEATTNKVVVSDNYIEGGDGGIGIKNLGNYNSIRDNLIFSGFTTLIQDNSASNFGSVIESNIIHIGSVVNGIGIDVQSSAPFGGNGKSVLNNSILSAAGAVGVTGLKITGTDPRIMAIGNMYSPRAAWSGAGSTKISDGSTNGVYGFSTQQRGHYEVPYLSRGAYTLNAGATLSQADVADKLLTLPDGMNYYVVSATSAASVNKIAAGVTSARPVTFRTTTANMTFTNGPYVKLAGALSWTGPGTITFMIERVGADNYAYEMSRTTF
ncbi:MAG: hypothetical protein V4484_03720 [Pseudomonadota bacterium]